jgi:hypothetical protein
MSDILSPAAAREHLHVGSDVSDEQLEPYIAAAEGVVSDFLNRPLIDAEKGWADVAALPPTIVHAVKVALTELYDNRAAPKVDLGALRMLIGRYVVVSFS